MFQAIVICQSLNNGQCFSHWRNFAVRAFTFTGTDQCCTVVADRELRQCRAVVELATHAETSSPSDCETVTNNIDIIPAPAVCTGGQCLLALCCPWRDD